MQEERNPRVRFKMDSPNSTQGVAHDLLTKTNEQDTMNRGNTPTKNNYLSTHSQPHHPSYTAEKQMTSSNSQQKIPQQYQNGGHYSNDIVISKYISIIQGLREELKFLEESNSNLLVELRESQDANYVLTEELRRAQRSSINILDELQACQTANTVLREELQRLELNSVKITRDAEKYKKANKLLREEIRDLKSSHLKRQDSIKKLQEKAKDIQEKLNEDENDEFKGVSSLKEAIDSIAENVEVQSLNGYVPTDSDNESLSFNSDIDDRNSLNNGHKTERVVGRRSVELPRTISNDSRYKYETGGLFSRKQMQNNIEFHIDEQPKDPPRVNGRRGTLEDILDEKTKNHHNGRVDINRNYPDSPSQAKKNTLRMHENQLHPPRTWQL